MVRVPQITQFFHKITHITEFPWLVKELEGIEEFDSTDFDLITQIFRNILSE
jgi:hypothetical protein